MSQDKDKDNAKPKFSETKLDDHKELMKQVGGGRVACPRGMRDLHPEDMLVREQAIKTIKSIFQTRGAVEIDTPNMERIEILIGQYGEDEKLIYHLQVEAENKERLALRYDLTVPLARYMLQHGKQSMKRLQMGPVFRRDKPSAGRFRQFWQCDYDVAGNYQMPRLIDAECLSTFRDILKTLDLGPFVLKVNSRKILDGMIAIAGIPSEKFRKVCSIIDELDKVTWSDAIAKLKHNNVTDASIEILARFVNLRGNADMVVKTLKQDAAFMANEMAKTGLAELEQVFGFLVAMGGMDVISFDLSLARGLSYYTGMIMEAFLTGAPVMDAGNQGNKDVKENNNNKENKENKEKKDNKEKDPKDNNKEQQNNKTDEWDDLESKHEIPKGAVGGGGRYDNMFRDIRNRITGKDDPASVDMVGFSIGIERIFALLKQKAKTTRKSKTLVYIGKVGGEYTAEVVKIAAELWKAGIATEFSYDTNPKPRKQIQEAVELAIPFVLFIGKKEVQANTVKLKDMALNKEEEVSRDKLVTTIAAKVQSLC